MQYHVACIFSQKKSKNSIISEHVNDVFIVYRILQKLRNRKTKVKHPALIYLKWDSHKDNSTSL